MCNWIYIKKVMGIVQEINLFNKEHILVVFQTQSRRKTFSKLPERGITVWDILLMVFILFIFYKSKDHRRPSVCQPMADLLLMHVHSHTRIRSLVHPGGVWSWKLFAIFFFFNVAWKCQFVKTILFYDKGLLSVFCSKSKNLTFV